MLMMTKVLILTHLAVTLMLVGLIWTIQVVHYPLFESVGAERYVAYQAGHQWRITLVVLPLMLVELATVGLLVLLRPAGVSPALAWAGALLLALIWGSTFFLQVPQHSVLDRGFDAAAHRLLVSTNWIRTIAWSARGAIALIMVARLLR